MNHKYLLELVTCFFYADAEIGTPNDPQLHKQPSFHKNVLHFVYKMEMLNSV